MARVKLILAIDQGTTNTKVLLVDQTGTVRAGASRPLAIDFPQPGWVEQDARDLWDSVAQAMDGCLAQAGGAEIAAVAITNQRESVVVWDRRTGDPAGPCITWQCRRTAPYCQELRARGLEASIRERSGLPVDPLFSASKARWLLANIPDGTARAAAGELCIGTVDSWLLWNLTGGAVHATDVSNASRTQLFNLRQCRWDEELLTLFGIPAACLPEVHASSGISGSTTRRGKLPAGVPVASLIGDSHAALFGHAAFAPGAVKATYGTGSSLMTPIDLPIPSAHGLSTTIAWAESSHMRYALEGNITNTGGAMQWLADFLGLAGGSGGCGRAGRHRAGRRRGLPGARLRRPGRATLGCRRPRIAVRADPRRHRRPCRQSYSRFDCLPGARRLRSPASGCGVTDYCVVRRRRGQPQQSADAISGGHSGMSGDPQFLGGSFRDRRRVVGRSGGRLLEIA